MPLKNSQYNTIMRQYDLHRQEAAKERQQRLEEVYKKIPSFAELDAQIASTAAEFARARISGQTIDNAAVHDNIAALEAQKLALLTKFGFPKDYLELHYHCPDCHDTGFIGSEKCHCFKQAVVDLVYLQSNIKERLFAENFDHFDIRYYSDKKDPRLGVSPRENMESVLKTCHDFIRNFDTDHSNLLFYGHTGVGKTFLSNCIAKELLDRAHTVIYLSAPQLIEIMERHTFGREEISEQPEEMPDYIRDCDLLIIDDLGTEMNNFFTTAQLFSCINGRQMNQKSTIISTNLSLDDLQENYSERIFSRLISHYQVTLILGDDIRIKKAIS